MELSEPEPTPEPVSFTESDRALLQKIADQVELQKADIDTIRWRTGCLFTWLVVTLAGGLLAFLFSVGR